MLSSKYICLTICFIVVALQLFTIISPHWSTQTMSNKINMGLWSVCSPKCKSITTIKAFSKTDIYAVRIFAILGFLLVAIAIVCCMMNEHTDNKCHIILLGVGGLCSLAAGLIWNMKLTNISTGGGLQTNYKLGYAFYINIVVALIALSLSIYEYNYK